MINRIYGNAFFKFFLSLILVRFISAVLRKKNVEAPYFETVAAC